MMREHEKINVDHLGRSALTRRTQEDRNEYKRRQSPPGIKITPRSFGKDRRMPITKRYDGSDFIP